MMQAPNVLQGGTKMNSALIAVIVEQFNKIVELESRIARLDDANTKILGDYLEAAERARELEIELNAKPDVPEPEDAYLSDFRVLKTAIEIVKYAKRQGRTDWELDLCRKTMLSIMSFTEEVRLWDGLDSLEPYRWSSVGSGVHHLIDKEWKK